MKIGLPSFWILGSIPFISRARGSRKFGNPPLDSSSRNSRATRIGEEGMDAGIVFLCLRRISDVHIVLSVSTDGSKVREFVMRLPGRVIQSTLFCEQRPPKVLLCRSLFHASSWPPHSDLINRMVVANSIGAHVVSKLGARAHPISNGNTHSFL